MVRVQTFVRWLVFAFPVSEIALALVTRAGRTSARNEDRGSMRLLWITICASVTAAIVATGSHVARFPFGSTPRAILVLVLLVGGLAFRWWAIVTLGRFFTVNVAVFSDHRLIDVGPYRYLRHPSYTGMLVAFAGVGVYFRNWLSLALIVVPITLATIYRISVEEAALSRELGPGYAAYCTRTKRLIPWIY
jgi:protein-S-isoprenylcysteine O-methyltransferase Ste14